MYKTSKRSDDGRHIMNALRLLVRELRNSAVAAERATGLSGAQLFVLRTLAAEAGLGVTALAARTLTHQSSVSVVVAKLEQARLIERVRSPDDGRRVVLRVTAAGLRLVKQGPDPVQERLLEGLKRLSPVVRKRLGNDLLRWTNAIGLGDSAPDMFFESSRDDAR